MDQLGKISKVTDNIYLSGVPPLERNHNAIKNFNITCILCCVDKKYVGDIHEKILLDNPHVMILYLPYNDDTVQNLWKTNSNLVEISSYSKQNKSVDKLLNRYQNKPLIDIGYNFIDRCIANQNNILVHCMAGISRSVSLVTYYLMKKHNTTFDTAYNKSLIARPIANPNISFKAQLLAYEIKREKLSENDVDHIIRNLKY